MTRGEIRDRALRALNDSPTAPVFWDLEELNVLVGEASETLCEEVEAFVRTIYVPLRPGVQFYHLGGLRGHIMTPWRLWTQQRRKRLASLSMRELDAQYERWLTVTGDPDWWFAHSWDCIGVFPRPAEGGGILEVDCYVWPDPLQEDTDEPEFPDPDHEGLVTYLEMEGRLKQWDAPGALALVQRFLVRARDAAARAGVRQVQERFFGREG